MDMVGHLCRWDLGLALNLSQVIEVIHNSNVSETHPLDDGLCAVVRPAAEVEAVSLHVANEGVTRAHNITSIRSEKGFNHAQHGFGKFLIVFA